MSSFRTPRGFEDSWKSLLEPRRYTDGRIMLTAAFRHHLRQIVSRSPQAIVRKSGGPMTGARLFGHLNYISRGGELPLEGRDGERLVGRPALRETANDWAADNLVENKAPQIAKSYVLSYPDDGDRDGVHRAARAFARRLFASNHEYLLTPHDDTAHPHVHVVVRALGDDGRRLVPSPQVYEQWRQAWSERLRDEGLDSSVTPRWTRGLVQKGGMSIALVRLTEQYEQDRTDAPRVLAQSMREALDLARGKAAHPEPWRPAIERRHHRLWITYRDAAFELWRSPDPEDQALAARVGALADSFPEPLTKRAMLVRTALEYDQRRARNQLGRAPEDDREHEPRRERERGRDRGPELSR